MEGDIKFLDSSSSNEMLEKERKIKRNILIGVFLVFVLILILSIGSFFSITQCFTEANSLTNVYSNAANSSNNNQLTMANTNLKTSDQFYSFILNQCIESDHLFEGLMVRFSFSFFLETLLLFLFLWFIAKEGGAMSLLKSTILAFYFSLTISFGISIFIISAFIGWGFAPKMLGYSWLKTFFIILGLIAVQYGILILLLRFI